MAQLMPIFQSIRENQSFSTSGIGFLHPITDDRVTLSAHGCSSHSWSRKISAPSRLAFTSGSSTPTGYSTLPRVFRLLCLWFSSFVLSFFLSANLLQSYNKTFAKYQRVLCGFSPCDHPVCRK